MNNKIKIGFGFILAAAVFAAIGIPPPLIPPIPPLETFKTYNVGLNTDPATLGFKYPQNINAQTIKAQIDQAIQKLPDHRTTCSKNTTCAKWLAAQKNIFNQRTNDLRLSLAKRSFLVAFELGHGLAIAEFYQATFFFLNNQLAIQLNGLNDDFKNLILIDYPGLADSHFDKLLALQYNGKKAEASVSSYSFSREIRHKLLHVGLSDTLIAAGNESRQWDWTPNIFQNEVIYSAKSTNLDTTKISNSNNHYKLLLPLFEVIRSTLTGNYKTDNYFCLQPPVLTAAQRSAARGFSGGDGSPENPFKICTLAQLKSLNQYPEFWAAHYQLMRDIDAGVLAKSLISGNEGDFTGVFDGNGYQIKLKDVVREPAKNLDYSGLFGNLYGATVKNLKISVDSFKINNPSESGFLSSRCLGATLENLSIKIGSSNVPILCGRAQALTIRKLFVDGLYTGITSGALIDFLEGPENSVIDQIDTGIFFTYAGQTTAGTLISMVGFDEGETLTVSNANVASYTNFANLNSPPQSVGATSAFIGWLRGTVLVKDSIFYPHTSQLQQLSTDRSVLVARLLSPESAVNVQNSYHLENTFPVLSYNKNGLVGLNTVEGIIAAQDSLPKDIWLQAKSYSDSNVTKGLSLHAAVQKSLERSLIAGRLP